MCSGRRDERSTVHQRLALVAAGGRQCESGIAGRLGRWCGASRCETTQIRGRFVERMANKVGET